MTYDATTLTVTIKNTRTGASATQTYTIDIPAAVGSGLAYVGFTGTTGSPTAFQVIRRWTFEPGSATISATPAFDFSAGFGEAGDTLTLTGTAAFQDTYPDPNHGQIVAFGGIDSSTDQPVNLVYTAAVSNGVVTPFTTMVNSLVQTQGVDVAQATDTVRSAFGFPADFDLANYDPIAAAIDQGDPVAIAVFKKDLMLNTLVTHATALAASASGFSTISAAAPQIWSNLATRVQLNAVDLSDPASSRRSWRACSRIPALSWARRFRTPSVRSSPTRSTPWAQWTFQPTWFRATAGSRCSWKS